MNIPENTKGLIFDIDGTLVDSMKVHYKACQIVCNELGFDFPLDHFYKSAGKPTEIVFNELMVMQSLPHDGDELAMRKDVIYLELGDELKLIKPVARIVDQYDGVLPMSAGTGANRAIAVHNLEAVNLLDKMSVIVSADDVSKHKPHPETFLKCAEAMNVKPQNCLVFEDGEPGLDAAKSGGMMSIDVRPFI